MIGRSFVLNETKPHHVGYRISLNKETVLKMWVLDNSQAWLTHTNKTQPPNKGQGKKNKRWIISLWL